MPCLNFVRTRQVQIRGARVTFPQRLKLIHIPKAVGIRMKLIWKLISPTLRSG